MSQYRGFGGGDDLPDPKELFEKFRQNMKFVIMGSFAILIVILAGGAYFTVEPEEQALVLRFGEPVGDPSTVYGPGLHLKVPFIDKAYIVPTERQHRIEFGFRSTPGKITTINDQGFDRESFMLTGDLSLVHVRWTVLYKIKDIEYYLFKVKDQKGTIRDVAMGVMREVVGDYFLDEVLTSKYAEIPVEAKRLVQKALDDVKSGVDITAVAMKNAVVPQEAKKAFDDLNRSVAEVKRQLVEAEARRKQVRGDAKKLLQETVKRAQGRRAEIIGNATGEAKAFLAKAAEYALAPQMTKQWMYLDSMQTVLGQIDEKIILDNDGNSNGVVKLLPLKDLINVGGRNARKGGAK